MIVLVSDLVILLFPYHKLIHHAAQVRVVC